MVGTNVHVEGLGWLFGHPGQNYIESKLLLIPR